MSEPDVKVPDTATVQRDLSRVLGAAIAGHPVDDAPVAWPEVFALARRHQLDPFLADNLGKVAAVSAGACCGYRADAEPAGRGTY